MMEYLESLWKPVDRDSSTGVQIRKGQTLLRAGGVGAIWRIDVGALRLEQAVRDGHRVVLLVLPGDVVGVEALCAEPYRHSVTALIDSVVMPEPVFSNEARSQMIAAAFMQQYRQIDDMAALRTGSVVDRLRHLLRILDPTQDGSSYALERKALPTLKDIAQIIDSSHETVCRELNQLMPGPTRLKRVLARSAWLAGNVEHAHAVAC